MIRIKFLCAGGTICMMPDGDVLRSPTSDAEFMEACAPSLRMFDGKVKIDYKYVTSKDSTNMLFSNWRELCLEIWQAALEQYDAVGITMGTNTLTHTATGRFTGTGRDRSRESNGTDSCDHDRSSKQHPRGRWGCYVQSDQYGQDVYGGCSIGHRQCPH